jgi:hypothetical protein
MKSRRTALCSNSAAKACSVITAIAPVNFNYALSAGQQVFATSLVTAPETKRVAISTPVGGLHTVVNELRNRGVKVEHVYDY